MTNEATSNSFEDGEAEVRIAPTGAHTHEAFFEGPDHRQPANHSATDDRVERVITLYRDDSTVQVVYDRVKTFFWTAGNTVLVIARYGGVAGTNHYYIHWPRERFCWFKDDHGV